MHVKPALLAITLASTPHLAHGNDFVGEDFSLRLPAALSGFSVYADVAAKGGSSAASKFGSSVNPAAMAWYFPGTYDYGISGQYSNVAFQEGTHLDFITEAATINAHNFGTIRFSFGNVSSNDRTIRDAPLTFTYDLSAGRVDWAKRWGAWAAGASVSHAASDTSFRTSQTVFADAERSTTIGRLGVQWEPAPHWLAGLVGEYGYAPTHTEYLFPTAFGLVSSDARDISRQFIVRPGLAYEWREHALINFDYQYARFWNGTGSFDVNRFSVGGDLPLARFLFVRAGAVVDLHGDFGWTAGFGFYPRKGVTFDFAYQSDVFPELQREFGHSRTLNASVSVQF